MQPEIKEWLSVASLLIAVGGFAYAWLTSGAKKASADLDAFKVVDAAAKRAIDDQIASHDRRVQAVENELKHLPSKDSISDLKLTIAELKGTVGALSENVSGMTRTVHLIDDYLRNEKK